MDASGGQEAVQSCITVSFNYLLSNFYIDYRALRAEGGKSGNFAEFRGVVGSCSIPLISSILQHKVEMTTLKHRSIVTIVATARW